MSTSQWQPIETAPLNQAVLLWASDLNHKRGYVVGLWMRDSNEWIDHHYCRVKPTHWMPLPPPPEEST